MHFTAEEQADIREKMFTEGIQLFKQYGPRRLTVDKLTKSCGIGKGTFYHFMSQRRPTCQLSKNIAATIS